MKLGAYLRVSTDRQAHDGLGLDIQQQAIKKWAKSQGHRIVDTFSDPGVSGASLDRPGLLDALDALRAGLIDGIVVARLDRLARDLILQEQLLREIRHQKGDLFSTAAGEAGYLTDDPDDPSRKLIRQVLGAVSEYERSMIALRLRSGRRRKAERGGYAYGSPAYGWRAEHGTLVEEPSEQEVIRRAVELHRDGASLRSIAATLSAEGHAAKRGRRWHPSTVARLLA